MPNSQRDAKHIIRVGDFRDLMVVSAGNTTVKAHIKIAWHFVCSPRVQLSNSQVMSIWPLGIRQKRTHKTHNIMAFGYFENGTAVFPPTHTMENQVKIICKQIELVR